jgi:hypothetical protein
MAVRSRRWSSLTRAGSAHPNLHSLFCLASLDDDGDARRLGDPVATGIRNPVIASLIMRLVDGPSRSTSWDPQMARAFRRTAPADGDPASPIGGNNQIERRAATDEEALLCEEHGARSRTARAANL